MSGLGHTEKLYVSHLIYLVSETDLHDPSLACKIQRLGYMRCNMTAGYPSVCGIYKLGLTKYIIM